MKKAFIAAPLLGTIIFLASILFVVNLSKAEAGDTALIASDAYHNRIVSILEIYRTDLGSQFRENLSRVIEDFLTSQCWDNLFQVRNADANNQPLNSMQDIRRARCEHVSEVIHQVICSFSSQPDCGSSDPQQPDYNPNYADCMAASGGKYGLPAWMGSISTPFTFEGVSFELSNPDQFEVFTNSQDPDYLESCQKLIGGSIFDCDAFAEGDFQCRDPDTDEIVPGCEQGTFYVKVNVLDEDIYPNLPRVLSDDQTGNQVRSGAVGDDNFYLPINYPLFKYYDYALGAFEYLAYGTNAEPGDVGSKESGVAEGFCAQNSDGDCQKANDYNAKGFNAQDPIDGEAKDAFYGYTFTTACSEYSTMQSNLPDDPEIDWTEKFTPNGEGLLNNEELIVFEVCMGTCTGEEGWYSCTDAEILNELQPINFNLDTVTCDGASTNGQCAFIGEYGGSAARMRFIDYDTSLQTNPNQRNQFCWRASPKHYPPS